MRSRRGLVACWFVMALSTSALAVPKASAAKPRPVTVSGQQLQKLLPGTVMHFDTPIGSTVRVTYGGEGAMKGRAPGLSFYLGSSSDRGRWWVRGRKLCQKWRIWFKGEARCFRVRKRGRRIHWVGNTGESGTARIASRQPTARRPKPKLKVAAPTKPIIPPKPKLIRTASIAARPTRHINGFETIIQPVSQPALLRVPQPNLARRILSNTPRKRQEVPNIRRTLAMLRSWFNSRSRDSKKKRLAPSGSMALGVGLPANHDHRAIPSMTVQVRPGDTLYALAKKHGSTVRGIMHANGMTTAFLRAGQKLTIPRSSVLATTANSKVW